MKLKYLKDDILYYWDEFFYSKYFIILPIILCLFSLGFIVRSYFSYSLKNDVVLAAREENKKLDKAIEKNEEIQKQKEKEVVKTYEASSIGNMIANYQNEFLKITDAESFDYKTFLESANIKNYVEGDEFFKPWYVGVDSSTYNWTFESNFVTDEKEYDCVWTLESSRGLLAVMLAKYDGEAQKFLNPRVILTDDGKNSLNEDLLEDVSNRTKIVLDEIRKKEKETKNLKNDDNLKSTDESNISTDESNVKEDIKEDKNGEEN